MCAGCDWPSCGGACGTDDWDRETEYTGTEICSKCQQETELEEVEATIYGRHNSGMIHAQWTCANCGEVNEVEKEWYYEDDRDPPEDDLPEDWFLD